MGLRRLDLDPSASANHPQTGAEFAAAYDASTHQFVITGGILNFVGPVNDATLPYSSPGSSTVTPGLQGIRAADTSPSRSRKG